MAVAPHLTIMLICNEYVIFILFVLPRSSADYELKYISAGNVMSECMDELSDETHSSMPSLEFMGSTPSMEVSSFFNLRVIGIPRTHIFLQPSVANVHFPAEVTAIDMAGISALDEVD
jgi:hypothetical protein